MGWNYPNPIYMYPRRKRRPQCSKCKYELNGKCYQRKYREYDYAELEGHTNQKCWHFEKGTKKDKEKLFKKIDEDINKSVENSGCCIIMCVLGPAYISEINIIRKWRDKFLKKSSFGRAFIKFYYHTFSPFMIQLINDRACLKKIIRHKKVKK